MINNVRGPLGAESILTLVAMLMLLLVAGAGSASAQAPQSSVSINSYSCPPDYDQVSDCTKIGGVVLRVLEDGQQLADVTTVPEAPAEVEVMFGAWIEVQYLSGAPEGSTLLLANYQDVDPAQLLPYEARVYKIPKDSYTDR